MTDPAGCPHYRRKCDVRAPCCGRFFCCHLCHDEHFAAHPTAADACPVEMKVRPTAPHGLPWAPHHSFTTLTLPRASAAGDDGGSGGALPRRHPALQGLRPRAARRPHLRRLRRQLRRVLLRALPPLRQALRARRHLPLRRLRDLPRRPAGGLLALRDVRGVLHGREQEHARLRRARPPVRLPGNPMAIRHPATTPPFRWSKLCRGAGVYGVPVHLTRRLLRRPPLRPRDAP